jgi:hypothetical protein
MYLVLFTTVDFDEKSYFAPQKSIETYYFEMKKNKMSWVNNFSPGPNPSGEGGTRPHILIPSTPLASRPLGALGASSSNSPPRLDLGSTPEIIRRHICVFFLLIHHKHRRTVINKLPWMLNVFRLTFLRKFVRILAIRFPILLVKMSASATRPRCISLAVTFLKQ